MKNVKWIKLDSHVWESPAVKNLIKQNGGYRFFAVWIALLCLAGNVMDRGRLSMGGRMMSLKEIAAVIGQPPSTVEKAVRCFLDYGLIAESDGGLCFENWDDVQSTDRLEQIREAHRIREKEYRLRKKEANSAETDAELTEDFSRPNKPGAENVTSRSDVRDKAFVTDCDAADKIREDKTRQDKTFFTKGYAPKKKEGNNLNEVKADASFEEDEFIQAALRRTSILHPPKNTAAT